jgi:PhoH-like ATPase
LHTADKSLAYLAKLQHKQVEFIADANRAFLENIYSGHREVWVTDAEYNDLSLIDTSSFYPNEYLLIRTHTGFRLGKVKGSRVVPVVKDKKLYGVAPKNLEQRFLFDAILDDDVKVIILSGSAGTGKTLVSLAGGLNGIESGQYSQLILAKSLASLNKQEETGYLPGSLLDKLIPQFANYTSNFEVLLGGNGRAMRKDGILLSVGESQINYLIDKGELALMSLDSVLGASFHKKFIIIDEAQSLDYKTLRCILTRISDDCKLILLGDILQETSAMSSPDKSALFIANRFLREAKAVATLSLSKVERGSACQEISTILDQIG